MERREMLGGVAVLAAASLVSAGAAAQSSKSAPAGKDAAKSPAAGGHHEHHGASAKTELLVDAVSDCINKGEACIAHCLILLGEGDKAMAACARSVSEMIAVCEGLRKLAAQGSKRAAEVARIAMNVCLDCEKECRKHENKHAECRACAKSCADCARECKSFAA